MKLRNFILIVIVLVSCEKQNDEPFPYPIVDKLLFSKFSGSGFINSGYIKLYYDKDERIDVLVLNNIENLNFNFRWRLSSKILADSIVFTYKDSEIASAVKHRTCRYYYDESVLSYGGLSYTDSMKTYSMKFERNSDNLVKNLIDSSQIPMNREFIYDNQNRLIGTKDSGILIKQYKENNVIVYSSSDSSSINYSDYDDSYNPFYLINKELGFSFFNQGNELSENNPGFNIFRNDTTENEIPFYREYNSKGRIIKISTVSETIAIQYKN